jgi:hypothetical protein
MSADINQYQRSIFGVCYHNTTNTKDPLCRVRQAIFGVGLLRPADTKARSMVSAGLGQPTPFERCRLQLYLNISNSKPYRIQIHIIIFTYIHSNNSQILYDIQIHCMYTFSYSQKLQSTSTVYIANLS